MTSKGHRLDKFAHTPALKRIIERGPWASYARCDECGVDAGLACRDEHDREALEVCDGRRLAIDDSVERKTSRRDEVSMKPHVTYQRRRGAVSEPEWAPCRHCGQQARLWGRGVATGNAWCGTRVCQAARMRAKQRNRPRADPVRACQTCGKDFRWRANHQRFCSERCRIAHRAPAEPSTRPDAVPCCGCGIPLAPKAGVRWRCCGKAACRVERRRRADQARYHRIAVTTQTMEVEISALQHPDLPRTQ